jgi:hypothetical protein
MRVSAIALAGLVAAYSTVLPVMAQEEQDVKPLPVEEQLLSDTLSYLESTSGSKLAKTLVAESPEKVVHFAKSWCKTLTENEATYKGQGLKLEDNIRISFQATRSETLKTDPRYASHFWELIKASYIMGTKHYCPEYQAAVNYYVNSNL